MLRIKGDELFIDRVGSDGFEGDGAVFFKAKYYPVAISERERIKIFQDTF